MAVVETLSHCSLCQRLVPPGNGYVVRIDVFADPQMPPMTAEQIAAEDFNATLAELIEQMKHMSVADLQDGVHRRFEFRLCPSCHRSYLANPLGLPRELRVGSN